MVVIERTPGQAIRIGPYIVKVLAVRHGHVKVALLDQTKDCLFCGQETLRRRRCSVCSAEALVCPVCALSFRCPSCASCWAEE
jgi:hypothetical protein